MVSQRLHFLYAHRIPVMGVSKKPGDSCIFLRQERSQKFLKKYLENFVSINYNLYICTVLKRVQNNIKKNTTKNIEKIFASVN